MIEKIKRLLNQLQQTSVHGDSVAGSPDANSPQDTQPSVGPSSTDLVANALRMLNSTPNIETAENGDGIIYFKYQGMKFRAFTFCSEGNDSCNIDYHAGVYSFSRLEHLRQVCNSANASVLPVHFYFIDNTKENIYNLYATATLTDVRNAPNLSNDIANVIEQMFFAQRNFEEAMKKHKDEDTESEENHFMRQHEVWMTHEMEMLLSKESSRGSSPSVHGDSVAGSPTKLLLTDFLESFYAIHSVEIDSISIATTRQSELIKDTLRIHSQPLLSPLVANLDKPEQAEIQAKSATITVNYTDNTGKTNNVIMTMNVEAEEQQTIYIRISALQGGECLSTDTLWGSTRNMPKARSWLMAVDKTTDTNRRAELKYKWEEAKKKAENNEQLSDEEIELCQIALFPHLADSAYRGRKLLNEKRYAEALRHFENINEYLERRFFDDFWDDTLREYFAHNSYYVGLCHVELGDPQRGATFMEKACLVYPCPMHKTGYVKALFRAGDFRILHVLKTFLEEIEQAAEQLKDEETLAESQYHLYDFLQQAMVLTLIFYDRIDDAIARLNNIIAKGPEEARRWAEEKLREIKGNS